MKESRRETDAFDDELQGKLNQLSQRRSHKKIKIKPLLEHHQQQDKKYFDDCAKILTYNNSINQKQFDTKNYAQLVQSRNKGYKQEAISYRRDKKTISQPYQKLNESSNQKQKQQQNETKNIFSTISNEQLADFLYKNMPQTNNIDLSFFLAKCLTQYSEQNQLNQQQIKMIFLQLQQQITTTDPNIISLNALQLAVKKKSNSIQLYIGDKISKSKIELQSMKVKQKQKKLQRSMHQYHQFRQQLDKRQKQLTQMENSLKEREKQITKKQKAYANKQKQLMERMKGHKKMLEEKAQKLSEAHYAELNTMLEKVEKKINTYERNMKYRVQSMNQKLNQIHRLREYKESDIKNSVAKQAQQKYEKMNANKNKKYENQIKQLNNKCEIMKKQVKQFQEENNKLMKICSKLQNKIGKEQSRLKQVMIQIDSKNVEIKQLKYLYSLKQKQNQQLMSKLCSQNDSSQHVQQNDQSFDKKLPRNEKTNTNRNKQKQSKLGVSKSKRSLTSKNKLQPNTNTDKKSRTQTQIGMNQIVQGYQLILSITIGVQNRESILATGRGKQLVQLCTRLFIKGVYCNNLVRFIVNQMVHAICENIDQSNDSKQNVLKIKSIFNQLETYHCRQNTDMIQKYMKSNSQKATKLNGEQQNKYHSCLYKLQIMYCLISNAKQAECWLSEINEIKQEQSIEQQMHAWINNGQQQKGHVYNFVLAIVIKLFTGKHQPNINMLQQCSDLVLRLKLVGQPKCNAYWQNSLNLGYLILKDFMSIVKAILQHPQYYDSHYEQVERVSILVQRLIVGHHIGVSHDSYQYLDRLRMKCKGSLLQMNMNSILQVYESQHKHILQQLDQICDD